MGHVDLDRLRSINYAGRTRGKSRVRRLEADGRTTGFQIDHGDGRQEAVVRPEPVVVKESMSSGEVTVS